ncbi:MAG: DUF4388 domain-containing protein [Actinomycetota bacterium]
MSLQGTLETIPLSDVLSLLAATKKSGELRVSGNRGEGRLWIDAGKVVGADVPRAATPVDAVFELLRLPSGTFAFESGTPAPSPGQPSSVEALLTEARGRLDVWKSIEAVVPSTRCLVGLTPELGSDSVTVSRDQWKQLVSVAAGGDVLAVMERLGVGEFEASRTVKELVDAGLAKVAPAPARTQPEAAPPAPRPPSRQADTGSAGPRPPSQTPAGPMARRFPAAGSHLPASTAPARPPATAPAAAGTTTPPRRQPAAIPAPARTEPRQSPSPVASREEAEELVHQLASLSQGPGAGGADQGQAVASETGSTPPALAAKTPATPAGSPEEEPINRGMLLKFLSSVRP